MSYYTTQLKLRFDPFDSTQPTTEFFAGGRRQNILDELQHLSSYSSQIAVVTGSLGSGKSTLSQWFATSLKGEFVVVRIQASLFMDQVQLLETIGTELGIDVTQYPSTEKLTEAIIVCASFLADKSKTIQLIIDDAHELGGEALQLVLDLVNRQVDTAILGEGGIKLTLLGESQLVSILGLLPRIDLLAIELEPFDLDETIAYLKFKLSSSGYSGKFPLDLATQESIWDRSRGVPGTINSLARDEFEQHEFGKPLISTFKFPKLHLVVATVLFAALLLGWFMTLEEYNETELASEVVASTGVRRIELTSPTNSPSATTTPTPVREELVTTNTVPVLAAAREPQVEEEVPVVDANLSLNTEIVALKTSGVDDDIVVSEEVISRVTSSSSESRIEVADIVEDPQITEPPRAEPPSEEPPRAEPILARSSTSHTLQLLGSHSESNVKNFIVANGGGNDLTYFETRFQDKPWFVVVYGNYPDRTQANAAISKLPKSLSDLKPWVRELSDIQQNIRQNLN